MQDTTETRFRLQATCNECTNKIYTCHTCNRQLALEPDQFVYCHNTENKHYCQDCNEIIINKVRK